MAEETISIPDSYRLQQKQLDDERRERITAAECSRRLDLIRIAKEVLLDNRRMKGVDVDDVTAADIVIFAKELADFVG